jgi:hypothetical protein
MPEVKNLEVKMVAGGRALRQNYPRLFFWRGFLALEECCMKQDLGSGFRVCARAWVLVAVGAGLGACHARTDYVSPDIGWHSADFGTVFGRLQRVADAAPEAPGMWVIRFGTATEPYNGELALVAPADAPYRFVGYSGGEMVQVKGRLVDRPGNDAYNGRRYEVDSIQLWTSYKQ